MIQNLTRHTLNRAKNALSEMKQAFQDDEMFSFKISEFVQAARAVTWHMQKQYTDNDKWDGWYGRKEEEMRNEPTLRFLVKARNYSEKEGPLPMGATRAINYGMSLCLVGEGSKPSLPVSETAEPLPALEPPKPKTIARWLWDVASYLDKSDKVYVPEFEKADVIKTCKSIVAYLDGLVNECEERFG